MMYKIPKVNKVTPLPDYKLLVEYATGERRVFDVKPYISGDWYGELADVDTFNTVHPCGTTVEWENGQDIAPHELYELSVPAGGV